MDTSKHTDEVIEDLIDVSCGEQGSTRERYLYREALRSLVRLAKAEQMYEMRADLRLLLEVPEDVVLH